jgi:type I restriction enzyme S subunit
MPHTEVSNVPIKPADLVGYKYVTPGQVVMNRMRASIGLFGTVPQEGLVSPDYAVFEPIGAISPDYFVYLFKTRAAGTIFRIGSKGLGTGSSGFMRLYTDRFGIIKAPLPPLDEQRAIVRYITEETAEIDKLADRADREVALIHEYRTRLIADVVTGKLDARAVELPPLEEAGELPAVGDETLDEAAEEESELEAAEESADSAE